MNLKRDGLFHQTLYKIACRLINEEMLITKGNKLQAAYNLGVSVKTLRVWIAKYPDLKHWHTQRRFKSKDKTQMQLL